LSESVFTTEPYIHAIVVHNIGWYGGVYKISSAGINAIPAIGRYLQYTRVHGRMQKGKHLVGSVRQTVDLNRLISSKKTTNSYGWKISGINGGSILPGEGDRFSGQ